MNEIRREYKGISSRTRALLDGGESQILEFKESVKAVDAEAIVAFANSDSGGTVLVGIHENKNSKGLQRGKIVGCQTSDRERLAIVDRANKCTPPIRVEVVIENTKKIHS